MKTLILTLAFVLAAGSAFAQQGFSTIEERMTGKEFTSSGLDKLSDQELEALNEWLRAHSVATLDNENQDYTDTRGFENAALADMDDSDVVSAVKGAFSGWSGDTVFELENGMVWEQVEAGTFYVPPTENAVVVIDKGAFGSWRLKAQGYNKTVRVERIE